MSLLQATSFAARSARRHSNSNQSTRKTEEIMAGTEGTHVDLHIADGTVMRAFVARPVGAGPHPGIMVFQEAFGVNAHIRDVAGRFAAEGYVAIAQELFHRTAQGFEGNYADFESVRPH